MSAESLPGDPDDFDYVDMAVHAVDRLKALFEKGHTLREMTIQILDTYQKTRQALQNIEQANKSSRAIADLCSKIRDEAERLVPKNFLEIYPMERLAQLPRYLEAMQLRAERGKNDLEKDRSKAAQLQPFKAIEQLTDTWSFMFYNMRLDVKY
jgi:ATP-dependent helicase HrpA